MGGGNFDKSTYYDSSTTRKAAGIDDFQYTKTANANHATLDPKRINSKVTGKLESRDSIEHPNSNAVVICFDVTGSNYDRAVQAQKALPQLMDLLPKYLSDPQISVAANDDYACVGNQCVQISEFESDNRIDESIRNIKLWGQGGGNQVESYSDIMFTVARKTSLDCFEKRNRKGYFFMYADERIPTNVSKHEIKDILGDDIPEDIPVADIISELKEMYHVFVMWPAGSCFKDAYKQYIDLFGSESVIVLENPALIAQIVAVTIGINEETIDSASAINDLVSVGVDSKSANSVVNALVPLQKSKAVGAVSGSLSTSGNKASRF